MPRMGQLAFSEHNSVAGLYMMVRQFFRPDFKMVEVGSLEGISTLLFANFVNTVYSVDCYDYKVPPEGRIPEHDKMFIEAERMFIERTKDVPNIIKIRKTSIEAAKDFENGSLDAVYIDAEHDEDSVREDIKAWRPKIKPGGILSGHDFWIPYIQKILVEEEGLLNITTAPDSSWCVPLPTVDLVAVACTKVPETIEAMRKSQAQFKFTHSILLTHEDIQAEGIDVIKIDKLDYKGYNEFIAMKLWQYIGSDYVLLVQNDSWILDGSKWREEWFKFDYIGSAWPIPPEDDKISYRTPKGELVRVGNGGFSFRSRKLLRAPTILGLEFTDKDTGFPHEDGMLCVHYRDELKKAGIKFAPLEVAIKFSRELDIPELIDKDTFGFHKYL
mgnify:CR=1 FL=1